MSFADLNVFVTALDDPCKISGRTWYINIYNCDGSILRYCGREYAVIRAPCGHRHIRVPPGCYRINAVWSFALGNGFYYVNHFTDSAVVQACCDRHQCVTLFNPHIHRCGRIYLAALQDAVLQDALPKELAQEAQRANEAVLELLPKPFRGGEVDMLDEIERRVREAEKKGKDKDKDNLGVFGPD